MMSPRDEYERRIALWSGHIVRGDRQHVVFSNLRLAVFAIGVAAVWLTLVRWTWSPAWLLLPVIAFGILAVSHARLLQRTERARRAKRVYERGLDRMEGRWVGAGPDGARFLGDHSFALDLDLFGRGSLFQLLDTARTEIGEDTLADWLRAPASVEEIRARQAAVDELRPMVDFREDVAVLAAEADVGRTGALAIWGREPAIGFTNAVWGLFIACAVVTAALAAASYLAWIETVWVVVFVFAHRTMALVWRERVAQIVNGIGRPERDLALVSALLDRVERQPFQSPRLASLRQALITDRVPPSRRIDQLRRLVSWLESRDNLMFRPVAYVLLLDPILAIAIDRWHHAYGPAVVSWLQVIGELEALSALATHAYEHPADPFPDLAEQGPLFEARALGHPLIPETVAVPNDLALGGEHPSVLIVSGSNMSGKSTLLRAVGVNVVLALAGGTVRATRLRLSPLAIGATLRVVDSLQDGHSRFYAEILRIRDIVDRTNLSVPVLFLLDEILHGTNSHDRRVGAEAIVRALVARGAIGLVTTHDLALTELAVAMGRAAGNVHFEDRIEQGRMVFDYQMRPGVVERSNALELMRAIGLDV